MWVKLHPYHMDRASSPHGYAMQVCVCEGEPTCPFSCIGLCGVLVISFLLFFCGVCGNLFCECVVIPVTYICTGGGCIAKGGCEVWV